MNTEAQDPRETGSTKYSHNMPEEFIAVGFEGGTTFALTGENAEHWVEGEPTHILVEITDDMIEKAVDKWDDENKVYLDHDVQERRADFESGFRAALGLDSE